METTPLPQLLEVTHAIHSIRTLEELEGVIFSVLRMVEPFDSALFFTKQPALEGYRLEGIYPSRQYSRLLKKEKPVFAESLLFSPGLFTDQVGPTLVTQRPDRSAGQVPFELLALLDQHDYKKAFYIPVTSGLEKQALLLLLSRQEVELHPTKRLMLQVLGFQLSTVLQRILSKTPFSPQTNHDSNHAMRVARSVGEDDFAGMIGTGKAMQGIIRQVQQVAPTDATVLVLGETGTGKELVAKSVHRLSPRQKGPLVKVNCAALPANLIESELFGHEKGAFTGATDRRIGKFELAHRGTLFLDEIGELPLELQAKLLRVLQEKEIERVGSNVPIRTDVRVIAATNRNLEEEVRAGRFRADLYYRLHVFPVTLPPLRERREDIPLLARHFARVYAHKCNREDRGIAESALQELQAYPWPGNIRELENLIEQATILQEHPGPLGMGNLLRQKHGKGAIAPTRRAEPAGRAMSAPAHNGGTGLPGGDLERVLDVLQQIQGKFADKDQAARVLNTQPYKLEEVERIYVLSVLSRTGGRIRGEGGAAEVLGVKPTTLESRIAKLGIRKEHMLRI